MPAEAVAVPLTVGPGLATQPASKQRGAGTPVLRTPEAWQETASAVPSERGNVVGQARSRMNDTELIREAQRGNRAAFEDLVRQYDSAVLRLAYHLTRNEQDAQDIYQEAFLKAYRNINNFRFECSFYTWIYRIVTNLCLDLLRKRQVRKEDSAIATDSEGGTYDMMDQVADDRAGASPEKDLMRRELGGAHCESADQADAARAHGFRDEALPGTEAAHHRRDFEYDGRDGEEHAVPRHAEAAGGIEGHEVKLRATSRKASSYRADATEI